MTYFVEFNYEIAMQPSKYSILALLTALVFSGSLKATSVPDPRISVSKTAVSFAKDSQAAKEIFNQVAASYSPRFARLKIEDKDRPNKPEAAGAFVAMVPVAEIPGTYALIFNSLLWMNRGLLRASIYSENITDFVGTRAKRTAHGILTDFKGIRRGPNIFGRVAGHNLPASKFLEFDELITEFDQTLDSKINTAQSWSATEKWELAIRQQMLDLIKNHGAKYFVAAAIDNQEFVSYFSHELAHSIFYLNPEYRTAVYQFWNTGLTDGLRAWVAKVITNLGAYNVEHSHILVDEFQAYLMQLNADKMFLAGLIDPYHRKLLNLLESRSTEGQRIELADPVDLKLSPYCRRFYFPAPANQCSVLFDVLLSKCS